MRLKRTIFTWIFVAGVCAAGAFRGAALQAAPAQGKAVWGEAALEAVVDSADKLYEQCRYIEMVSLLTEALQKADPKAAAKIYAGLYHSLSLAYIRTGDFEQALLYSDLGLQKYTEIGDTCHISGQLSCLAAVYMMDKQSEKGVPYIEKAIEIERAHPDCERLSARLGMLCDLNINLGNYAVAMEAIQEALAIDSCGGDEVRTAYRRSQMGEALKNLEQYAEAERQCLLALQVFQDKGVVNSEAIVWRQLGSIYNRTHRGAQASQALKRCIEICQSTGNLFIEQRCWNDLSECTSAPALALQYFKRSAVLKDSIYNKETRAKLDEYQVKYETREKEIQIERQKAELQRQKTRAIILTLSILLLTAIVALCVVLYVLQRRHSRRLKQEIEAQNLFLAILSHDLKNPVQAQRNVLEMLYRQGETVLADKELLLSCLEKLYKSSKHQLDLLYKLLDWGRLRIGRMEPKPEVFDLEERARRAAEALDAVLLEKNITVNFKCLSPCKTVFADKRMIETVLRNLLDNAAKFSPKDAGIDVEVYAPSNTTLAVKITDRGPGMEADVAAKAAGAASTAGASKAAAGPDIPEKTGLGLVISRQMLRLNKGSLQVESTLGKGSVFTVILPAKENNL